VDTVDIEFLRQSRRVFLKDERNGHHAALDRAYGHQAVRELNVYGAADAVLTVSQKEAELVADFLGRSAAFSIPLAEDSIVSPVSFADRKGMFFLGNFRHPPNVQAVEYLCDSILPRVASAVRSKHPVYVVGNEFNETVLSACRRSENVKLVGWVPSVLPYLQQARVSLVPLLYGAGTKTKLIHSLMVGTPTVSTIIGVEGLNLQNDVHVMVANDPKTFASSIERLVDDEALWHRLSEQGRQFISAVHGREAVFARFSSVFEKILHQHGRT
jgi:glycosyltransferase involved in cell wall biosynthesis